MLGIRSCTHALVPNKLRCADGVWRTIDGHEIYHHKKAAGAVYQAALRAELHARLGVVFEPANAHGQAEIAGVPTELMTAWSKRAAQIAAEAGPTIDEYEQLLGRDLTRDERATVTKTAVLKTRPRKDSSTRIDERRTSLTITTAHVVVPTSAWVCRSIASYQPLLEEHWRVLSIWQVLVRR